MIRLARLQDIKERISVDLNGEYTIHISYNGQIKIVAKNGLSTTYEIQRDRGRPWVSSVINTPRFDL